MYAPPIVLASFDAARLPGAAYGGHAWGLLKHHHHEVWHDDGVGSGSQYDG
jgi:hypothetical protein